MKTVLGVIFFSALAGVCLGTALGYIEARGSRTVAPPTITPSDSQEANIKGPRAEAQETTFNFDRMERSTSMKHAFQIRNVGDAPLNLEVASTTCKCTVGDLEKSDLAPGETTEVELEWTAKTNAGPFRHGATIGTNDPLNSRIEFTVEGEVVESTSLQPPELLFGTVSKNGSKTATIYLVSNLQEKAEITKYEFSDPEVAKHIKLEITPVEKSALPSPTALSGAKVTASYEPGKSLGPFFTWLTLETNLEKAQKLTVPVAGTVVGDISIFGSGWIPNQGVLRMGNISSKEGKNVRLNVAVRGEHAATTKLEVASVDPPELKVSLGESKQMSESLFHTPLMVEIPAGTRPMIRIAGPVGEDTHKGDGVVVLKTTHPDTTEVKLLVRFSVE
jgi:hypothetical protein